ncbi:MAG TPA: TonB-dependent receptor [Candidatus Aquabacterium excrementipullorum]|nr:TonB-dependent receptor [Candidatus Aquabacterium excrementipullorum]
MAPFKTLPVAIAAFALLQGLALQAQAQAQAQQASAEPTELDTVTVSGRGETRQVSRIGKEDLAAAAPGSSPIKALAKLPGVNFNSSDALGNYEWGSRISIRGFNQNQLGFTLDDVPLGDMSYRNFNGLHISRAIASENIGRIVVSQGVGALGVASTSNLGGALQFYSADPADKRTVTVEQTVGQDSNLRTFARFDSGLLSDESTKFSLSAVRQYGDKWKGEGEQRQQQFNSKVVTRFGGTAKLSAFFNWSDRREVDYMDQSKDSVRRLGYDWDYYAPNWQAAINSANHVWSRGETSEDDAYFNGSGLRADKLLGVTLDYYISDAATLKTTVYHHGQQGTGTWWLPNPPQVSGSPTVPVALRTLEFDIDRSGLLTGLTVEAGIHNINTGLWFEDNLFNNAMRFYNQDGGPSSPYERPSNPYLTRWDYKFHTRTVQFHLQDTLKLTQQLTANVGFKSPHTTTSVESKPDTSPAFNLRGELTAKSAFLPQAGLNYKLDARNELFADAAKNIRAYRGVVKGGASPFDTTQAGFDAIKDRIKPESSVTIEGGWRYRDQQLETSLTAYHVEFKNRLLALQQGSAIAGNASVLSNVGKVVTNGLEGFVAWQPVRNLKWSNSLSFNDSKYDDDFTSDGVTYASGGKQVVDAPKVIAYTQLAYDNGVWSGQVGANYTSKRYYTFTNDNSVGGYTLVDAGGGYRWKSTGWASEIRLRAGVSNLFDKKYFALGDNPFPATDPNGQSYNILAGAPRTAYVTVGATF